MTPESEESGADCQPITLSIGGALVEEWASGRQPRPAREGHIGPRLPRAQLGAPF